MTVTADPRAVALRLVSGDTRSLARAISWVEDGRDGWLDLIGDVWPKTGGAEVTGITGPPGAGKSTLVDRLIHVERDRGRKVAVLAVDPSSPFTGGAILGDRIRMQDHAGDRGVYIRSASSRGHLGGIAETTAPVIALLDAAGFDVVFVETVGVGQSEVEIIGAADVTMVVVAPGWGDSIQANKAGLVEAGDLFVVNKADRSGADDTVRELRAALDLAPVGPERPPVVPTIATTGEGIDQLTATIDQVRSHLVEGGLLERRRREHRRRQLQGHVRRILVSAFDAATPGSSIVGDVEAGTLDPWTGAARLAESLRS